MREFLPKGWENLIQICTISEVIGIIPKEIENIIFNDDARNKYRANLKNLSGNLLYFDPKESSTQKISKLILKILKEN